MAHDSPLFERPGNRYPSEHQPPRQSVLVAGTPSAAGHEELLALLAERGCQTRCVESSAQLNDALRSGPAHDLALVFLSDPAGRLTLPTLLGSGMVVVPVVDYTEEHCAAALLKVGCIDYLLTPFSAAQLDGLLRRQAAANNDPHGFICESLAGRKLLAMAQRVANSTAPVLISGETGTGKELLARYIHDFGRASKAPFVAVNCAAIPEQMLESLLFGHERGAFTGAVTAQAGKFELANGGSLLLDEVGELPLGLQAKLLRVLQEQRVERLGARREIVLDVRVIAATNRNLEREVAEGRFRADLMFRLDVLALQLPPLRERTEDILPLARRFIGRYAPHESVTEILTGPARLALLQHPWPGNIRELENTLQRALIMRNGLYIQPHDLGFAAPAIEASGPASLNGKAALRASGKWAEHQHVLDALEKSGGHKSKAAYSLGMTPRALRYRLSAMREQGLGGSPQ